MPQGALLGNLLLFALPVLLIVWMVMTQRRRQRETQAVQAGLSIGDEVMTTAGMFGRIIWLDEKTVTLDAGNGTQLRFDRRAIAGPAPEHAGQTPVGSASAPVPPAAAEPQAEQAPAAPQDTPGAASGDGTASGSGVTPDGAPKA